MSSYSASSIPVTPVLYSNDVKYISSFRYAVLDFDINHQITFRILLLDQNGQPLEVRQVEMAGCDYANWGNDDTYLINFISKKLGFSTSIIQSPNISSCPLHITDASNNSYSLLKLQYDPSGNMILPLGYGRDANNNVVDSKGQIVTYQLLSYNTDGVAIPYGSVAVDSNQNPILPTDGYIDTDGMAKDSLGEHIILVSPV
jgi:hypothetical protein